MTPSRDITRLLDIMAALRTPGTGCPWDLEQDFATIAPYTIEEAYEVADAIARGDLDDLRDELGDLLLQVVFHARMAQEQGAFDFGDVVAAITEKLLRRHPHVFADARGLTAERSKPTVILPQANLRRIGFREEEALLPYGPRGFSGYRLLHEYFACPQRFLFFEIDGLLENVVILRKAL